MQKEQPMTAPKTQWFENENDEQEAPPRSSHELTYSDTVDGVEGGVVSVRFPDTH